MVAVARGTGEPSHDALVAWQEVDGEVDAWLARVREETGDWTSIGRLMDVARRAAFVDAISRRLLSEAHHDPWGDELRRLAA